jgi:hypothetical protein
MLEGPKMSDLSRTLYADDRVRLLVILVIVILTGSGLGWDANAARGLRRGSRGSSGGRSRADGNGE